MYYNYIDANNVIYIILWIVLFMTMLSGILFHNGIIIII